jgi:hypothetical protein
MESTFFLKNAVALTSSLESETLHCLIRYSGNKQSMLSFLNLVDQVYIFLWGQESTLDLAKIKAWSI